MMARCICLEAYLDNSATTPLCEAAKKRMQYAMDVAWGNPSSLHHKGMEAEALIRKTKEALAAHLGCKAQNLVFTSGGTEANNLAVFGAALSQKRKGNKLVVSSVEHPSVLQAAKRLASQGYELSLLPVDRFGVVPAEALEEAVDENTVLVSLMAVNNELGAIEPIEEAAAVIRRKRAPALFHIDAVQAFGKLPVQFAKTADLVTVSAHKIHGPKGVGALYIKDGVRLQGILAGGEQEKGLRPGTEPTVAIAGFLGALEELDVRGNLEKVQRLHNGFVKALASIDGIVRNSGDAATPYIIHFSLPGLPSEVVLNFLSARGVCVSSGSACAKGRRSPVLAAAGLPAERANSAIRVSLSEKTTPEELRYCTDLLREALCTIRKRT